MARINKRTNNTREVNTIINLRYKAYIVFVCFLFAILLISSFGIQVARNNEYTNQLEKINSKLVVSSQPPRGVIYDRNHNVVVGNKAVYTIKYTKPSGYGQYDSREYLTALELAKLIKVSVDNLQSRDIKDAYIRQYENEAWDKLTAEEKGNSDLSLSDKHAIIRSRITDEDLDVFSELELEAIAIYTEMNRGYKTSTKIIKNVDVSGDEYALISENESNLPGVSAEIDWVRYYPYGDLLKHILGRVTSSSQGIPLEVKDLYKAYGYELDDRVGSINSLEQEFELFLNSVKEKTLVNDSGLYELITEAEKGNDIVLTIDFELQKQISDAIDAMLLEASQFRNSKYLDRAFVMITDPRTGEILAMVGRKMNTTSGGEKYFTDFSHGIAISSVLIGSTVKPAFLASAMDAGVIDPGKRYLDECILVQATAPKCSWRPGLGVLDDVGALYNSSNSYMFKTVIEWAGADYVPYEELSIDLNTFSELRKYYEEFGLGMKSNFLPREDLGYTDLTKTLPGYLMDLSIGQLDQYTVSQLSQYITTLANGEYKMKPRLLKEVYSHDKDNPLTNSIYNFTPIIDSKINIDSKYIERVRYGMHRSSEPNSLLLGRITANIPRPAAKTGTAEGFYDTDGDGYINTEYSFITESFIGFAPYSKYEDPTMALAVVIPNVGYLEAGEYRYPARENLTRIVSKIYYEMYE